ncbi:hypothetical protein RN001_003367 [Aquatica leii]|uniref:4-coumarate--CoA ligase n=1 Tax=Aquatica leii TaxID=1421715 RepID=A0AAN7PNK9_9COLE|nr:hypothetical protein RN001_003367 [Aquatica leii]
MYINISNLTKRVCWKKLLNTFKTTNVSIRCSFVTSPHENVDIPNTTLAEFMFESFNKYSNETAVECSQTGKKYTYNEIRIKSKNFNNNLRKKLKLNKGDVIGVMLPNVPDYPICLLGSIQAGLTVTLINPFYTADEISYQLNDANVKAIITLGAVYSTAKAAAQISQKNIPILAVKLKQADELPRGSINLNEFTENAMEVEDIHNLNVQDTILLPFSSGTTGLPKGVELTHYNIIANICQLNCNTVDHVPTRTETHTNTVPAILPWFHIYGTTVCLFKQMHNLSKIISVPTFTPNGFIELLKQHKPNILYLVPPLISFMSSNPSIKPEFLDRLTVITSGAAPLGKLDEEKFITKIGRHVDIFQGYGLTETSPAIAISTSQLIKKFGNTGSCGLVVPNTSIKIVSPENPSTELLGTNQKGEILIKGPQVMKGYLNRPKETNQVFLDGWLRSGDLGYLDDNNLLYVTDRLKEIIKVKGYQVAPAELEEILRSYKDVSDAGVIGVPDSTSGEVPVAFVVPKLNTNIDVKSLHHYMSKKVASYKQLKGGIIVVNSLPKTGSGKLLRKELKLQYEKTKISYK